APVIVSAALITLIGTARPQHFLILLARAVAVTLARVAAVILARVIAVTLARIATGALARLSGVLAGRFAFRRRRLSGERERAASEQRSNQDRTSFHCANLIPLERTR